MMCHDSLEVELGVNPKQANSALPFKQNHKCEPYAMPTHR